jgi:hypothetical protein
MRNAGKQEECILDFSCFPAFLILLRLLFSLLGFLLPLGVLIHRVEAFGAIAAEVELCVGRLLGLFGELSLQELTPSLVARSLDFPF